jgi:ubiquinone/menaquinone biosynthesis C-methylase UbiE
MLAQSLRRNADSIRTEQVQWHTGHADALPLLDATVEAVLAVHL